MLGSGLAVVGLVAGSGGYAFATTAGPNPRRRHGHVDGGGRGLGAGSSSTSVVRGLARYRVLGPFREAARHRLRVHDVVTETPGVASVVLSGRRLDDLRAEPGQFFRWRFLTPDTWLSAHPFSLSAPPRPDRLRLTAKALGDGSKLLQSIVVGTWVVAEGPHGSITAARRTKRNVLLIAGGVGITPVRALFETMPLGPDQDVTLLYRARSPEHLVFRAELDEIATRRHAPVVYLLGDNCDHLSGRSLNRFGAGPGRSRRLPVRPTCHADAVRRSLDDLGLSHRQLHEERFAF